MWNLPEASANKAALRESGRCSTAIVLFCFTSVHCTKKKAILFSLYFPGRCPENELHSKNRYINSFARYIPSSSIVQSKGGQCSFPTKNLFGERSTFPVLNFATAHALLELSLFSEFLFWTGFGTSQKQACSRSHRSIEHRCAQRIYLCSRRF